MKPVCTALACLVIFGSYAAAQTLEATPSRVMTDETAVIRAKGLQPNEHVLIRAELKDGAGERWRAQAEFVADPQGAVDVSQQAPVTGSYKEVSAMGLVWSMMPESKKVAAYQPIRDMGPQLIDFELLRKGEKVGSAHLEQVTPRRRCLAHSGS